jgi:hypothetical protein
MDALESHLLLEKSKVKSPGFAATLAFFFPAFGCLYVGRIGAALVCLFIDFINLVLAIVGIGLATGFLFRLIVGFLASSWAKETNRKALESIVSSRRHPVAEAV